MDIARDSVKKVYFTYLLSSFGSAMIASIYSLVDMMVVGKYHGPIGSSTLASVAPVWNIIFSIGLLAGIGGSVMYSSLKKKDEKEAHQYFTGAMILVLILSILAWLLVIFFQEPLFRFFGADDTMIPLAKEYVKPIMFVFPFYAINQFLAAFLRNDNAPKLATLGVLIGGIFNVFADFFFTFTLDMGIEGAGIATALGIFISFVIMLTHFFSKKNTLRLEKVTHLFSCFGKIMSSGFSTFIVDIAMGFLTILMNRQIMKYLGSDALSIYGTIINVSTIVTCFGYAIGQAIQPIISVNFSLNQNDRVKQTLKYGMITAFIFGIVFCLISEAFPKIYVYFFMKPTESVLNLAPNLIRFYALSFLLLPFNVVSTYYFQAILKTKISVWISLLRGIILSSIFLLLIPLIFTNKEWIFFTMNFVELLVFLFVIWNMKTQMKINNKE